MGEFLIFIIFILIAIVVAVNMIFLMWLSSRLGIGGIELPEKRAGRQGERIATAVIQEILRDDDILLTNVGLSAVGKQTELDNLIINRNGVFIIEVKNYSGELYGDEDDQEWIKTKMTPGGSLYQKAVKNPVKQVKRQIYILSQFLKNNGIKVWINGYVFFVQCNAPCNSPYILKTQYDIDMAIHGNADNTLSEEQIKRIKEIFYHG